MTDHNQNSGKIALSVVIPVYFNEQSLVPTYESVKQTLDNLEPAILWEIVFVDDGSGDDSLRVLLQLTAADKRVKVLKLTRNFGQVPAILAGCQNANGTCTVVMSADGQDPPSLIKDMYETYAEGECDVVLCERQDREESAYRKWTSKIFYRTMQRLSFPNMPPGGFDYFLLGPRALKYLATTREANPFLQGLVLWPGFNIKTIPYTRLKRQFGRSRWSFFRKMTYLLDGILSYSFFPIRLISFSGLATALLGMLYALVVIGQKLFWGHPVEGWTPLMVVVLVLGGTQLVALGVFGEYLWRILAQVLQRDHFVIDQIYTNQDHPPSGN